MPSRRGSFTPHRSISLHDIALELGDVLWYAALLAYVLGYTLDDIACANLSKLGSRYPNGFPKGVSANRGDR